jgi:hypothetical protein
MNATLLCALLLGLQTPPETESPSSPAVSEPAAAPPSSPAVSEPASRPRPDTATSALDQAAAAYAYGDMNLVVESARIVVEGGVSSSTPSERADALRFLGIGLYLTGRIEGSRVAFTELLRQRPETYLDPTTTRPEVVAFFGMLKRDNDARLALEHRANLPNPIWNLFPPMGQFNNGDSVRGWALAGAMGASFTAAVVTKLWLVSKRQDGHTFGDATDTAATMETINHWSVGIFATAYVVGVIDGFLRHGNTQTNSSTVENDSPSLSFGRHGSVLSVSF